MATTNFYPGSSSDDWTEDMRDNSKVYNQATIYARYLNLISPPDEGEANVNLDTSSIGTDVISAARFYFNPVTRTLSKGVSATVNLYVTNSGGSFYFAGTYVVPSTNFWYFIDLNQDGIDAIDRSGDTRIVMRTPSVSAGQYRIIGLRSYDNGSLYPYLRVTHAPGARTTVQIIN